MSQLSQEQIKELVERVELLFPDCAEALDESVHGIHEVMASNECNASTSGDEDEDEAVYEEHSEQASSINNGGYGAQVPFLVNQGGMVEAEILEILQDYQRSARSPAN